MNREIKIVFQPSGKQAMVQSGTLVIDAAVQVGLAIESPCGGEGTCGKCLVRFHSSIPEASSVDIKLLGEERVAQGYRLACQTKMEKDAVVEIPEESLLKIKQKILLRDASEGRSGASEKFGVALDIGTTTLVGTLVDLESGQDIAVEGIVNPQVSMGDDVISRIKKCREERDGLDLLNSAVIRAVNGIIKKLAEKAGIDHARITELSVAGNSAMQEIFCKIDPSSLGEVPFCPAFTDAQKLKAGDMGLGVADDADVFIFPQIGGFVGGDTVAGIVAEGLLERSGATLFIDIGTNGEIVLARDGRILAASAAAGPAFEGARIINGMRAAAGAIERVDIADNVNITVIGGKKAAGICGSGLIDAVAGFLNAGVLDSSGRILSPDEAGTGVSGFVRDRIVAGQNGFDFVIAEKGESSLGRTLCLCQKDIREFQLAVGAIRAGVNILLKMEGIKPSDLDAVLLAGAFGNFIRRASAVRTGIIPDIDHDRVNFVGNTASLGAKLALVSDAGKELAEKAGRAAKHIDLSKDPSFHDEFCDAMIFPVIDVSKV